MKNKLIFFISFIIVLLVGAILVSNFMSKKDIHDEAPPSNEKVQNAYYMDVDIIINENENYTFVIPEDGMLSSLKLNGEASLEGTVEVYLLSEGKRSFLLFESQPIKDEYIEGSLYAFTPEEDEGDLDIVLSYNNGTGLDEDNDGQTVQTSAVDFKFELINDTLNDDKLCTQWKILSLDSGSQTEFCKGDVFCCNFIETVREGSDWSEDFYLNINKYGATVNNKVGARVIYTDVNYDVNNPKSDIFISDWNYLDAIFFPSQYILNSTCKDNCVLPALTAKNYTLEFRINGSEIRINSIEYDLIQNQE
jgi:hypothetical protein